MTKTLILMRHAKSGWGDPTLQDHDRPLSKRGYRSAKALGDWLRDHDYLPDQILCSSARRTQETCTDLALSITPDIHQSLYLAPPLSMMRTLKQASGDTVLLIAHNPGIAELAEYLVAAAPAHSRFYAYPTGATTVMRFDISDWGQLKPGSGDVVDFVVPRELTD